MEAATGERIVAFGLVGKPLENRFLQAVAGSIGAGGIAGCDGVQRNLKPLGVRLWSGELPTWL
jgi:hypothetical protein